MKSMTEQWLEAHVQHELARFGPRKLRLAIREEVAAAFHWAGSTRLRELVTPEQVVDLIERTVVQLPLAGGAAALARDMSQRVRASRHNRSTAVQDICPGPVFAAVVARIATLEGPRQSLIHRLVTSSVYTEQISNALFNGIKEYLLSENMLAQKVPGLASLIKLGKFAVNKTMRPLEAAVEKTVKAYIETNLGNTIRRSEQSINDHFDAAHIVNMGNRVWEHLAPRKLAEFMAVLDGNDLDDLVGIGVEFWEHFRKTAYFRAVNTDLVRHFFEKYGDTELSRVAADFGVTEKQVVDELVQVLGRGIDKAAASGFLEQRIRARLEDFYRSPRAAALIAAQKAGTAPAKAKPARKSASAAPSATPDRKTRSPPRSPAIPPAAPAARRKRSA